MDVNIVNLQTLFAIPARYVIPPFQRQYVWDQDDQWEPLWEDVQNAAERYLLSKEVPATQSHIRTHFLGAIVLQQLQVPTPMLKTSIVVDGQQRLTTMQLLLDAVQEVFSERGNTTVATRLENLVLNHEAYRGDDPDHAFKVWPTRTDQDAFRTTMHNHLTSEEHENSLIVEAHKFFKLQATQWLNVHEEQTLAAADALEQALTQWLQMVVIDLGVTDDPHVIFETLNARGTPLLQSDLVKNMLLYEVGEFNRELSEQDTARLWPFTAPWWREEVAQGRLVRPRIDVYLNYWMVLRTQKELLADEVFSAFRSFYSESGKNILDIAYDIERIARFYEALEKRTYSGLGAFLERKETMQAGVLNPVLLWLVSSGVPNAQLLKGIQALESFNLRRMVCRMSTMGHNRLFISLLETLEKSGPEGAGDTIVDILASQSSAVGKWPTDQEFQHAFTTSPLFRLLTRSRMRMLLEAIETELRSDKAETSSVPRALTIEHILPRQWRARWFSLPDAPNTREAEENRDTMLHTIGNLTLVTQRLNAALSNAPWVEKKDTLNKHSTLFLNKSLLEHYAENWNESTIHDRSLAIFQVAKNIWPHANAFR